MADLICHNCNNSIEETDTHKNQQSEPWEEDGLTVAEFKIYTSCPHCWSVLSTDLRIEQVDEVPTEFNAD